MSVLLTFTGSEWNSPDHAVGYGTAIPSPSTLLSNMVTHQYYYQEAGQDIDVVFCVGRIVPCVALQEFH